MTTPDTTHETTQGTTQGTTRRTSGAAAWNRRLKRWPSWIALVLVVVGLLAVGATRNAGVQTPDDRVDSIARRIACPTCDGESVYESRSNAAISIRNEIREQVGEGVRTDTQIIDYIADRFGGEVLLVPTGSGLDALVWALPAAAAVCGIAALAVAFRRWQVAAREQTAASADDYALVEAARDDVGEQPGA